MSMPVVTKVDFRKSPVIRADADRTDIRAILSRAKRTGGAVGYMTSKQAMYADISEAPDYITALNIVARAQGQFEALPSEVRDRFNNDPGKFLAFANDVKNKEEMIKMGLRKPDPVAPAEPTYKVEVVNPAPKE